MTARSWMLPLVSLLFLCPAAPSHAQVDYGKDSPWDQRAESGPDAKVPGWFYNLGITGLRAQLVADEPKALLIKYVFPNSPADGHVKVGDLVVGAGGRMFQEKHRNGYGEKVFGADGPISELARVLEECQSADRKGKLPLTLRRGKEIVEVVLDVGTKYGTFAPTFPHKCQKSDLILAELLQYLADHQQKNGSFGDPVSDTFAPLALLASGEAKYLPAAERNVKYHCGVTKAEDLSLINWSYMSAAIVLSEYYLATGEKWVLPELQKVHDLLAKSQYLDMSQINPKAKKSHPDDFPKGPKDSHGGWGHNPGFEGYGPIAMLTGQGALAYSLMHRCGITIDRKNHDAAYDFLKRGTGENGYVWYGDKKGGGPNNWADHGRTGAAGIANFLSPYDDAVYRERALSHAKVIGKHPQSFPDTHGSPMMGMAYAALAASIDSNSFRKLMDANRWWFTMAHCADGSFYYQPNRDNSYYGSDSRMIASSVTAFIFTLPKRSLVMTGKEAKAAPKPADKPVGFYKSDMSSLQAAANKPETVKADSDKITYDSVIKPFLNTYCTSCHGSTNPEGDVTLNSISANLAIGKDIELWNLVLKQLVLSEMPPSTEKQPATSDVKKVIAWINAELNKSGNAASLYQKLEHPDYGNLVNHEKLFNGEIKTKPFSPARLWRTSPNVFDNIKFNYGGDARSIRQPFLVEDRKGIKEYANLLFADSAVVEVLLVNAGYCADQLILKDSSYKEIASQKSVPNQDQLEVAASQHFKKVVFRDPTKEELNNYIALFSGSAKEGGNSEALRVMLMAIMLHPESVYRIEIGLGEADSSGRRMLSSTELAFAISYALTDRRPDSTLLQAVESGKLTTKDEVREQISRMLDDESLEKPRILRFFQEFFGYNQAHLVFKDEARSGGFRYYGENYPVIYERDADFFVLNILEKDKNVFKQLLTSDEYFILNRQTFRNTIYDFYEQNKQLIDNGQLPEEKSKEVLKRLGLKDWKELNKKYYLHGFDRGFNGSPEAIKKMGHEIPTEGRIDHRDDDKSYEVISQGMHTIYQKYPMAYDLKDGEQNFLLPQPYKRPNRAGMLTHPAWLIAHSLNDISDPIRRGKWIRQRLLAGVVLDVPITVDATIPEDHHKTLRERLSVTEAKACWRCHEQMNPLGYTFEIYDDFGQFRTAETLDKLPKVDGNFPSKAIDSQGVLAGTSEAGVDGDVKDALELIHKLANSDKVRQSFIRHVFRYYMGRNEMLSDSMTLIAADKAYLESGGSFKALLISLLTSDSFLYRKTLTKEQLENELRAGNKQQFDILVMDAFSGDSVPTHLLTREACGIYLQHLKPDGILVFNITNTHLDLHPVVTQLADHYELGQRRFYRVSDYDRMLNRNYFVLLSKDETFLQQTKDEIGDLPEYLRRPRRVPIWTDDYTNLTSLLR